MRAGVSDDVYQREHVLDDMSGPSDNIGTKFEVN